MKRYLSAILLSLILPVPAIAAGPGPAEVVQAFNSALTARKLEEATALLANGSVQFTLRPAHSGITAAASAITSDLKTHWKSIAPVVYSVTAAYKRVPKILDTRVDGDLATVWTQVASETVERSGKSRKDSFSEVYLMVRVGGAWRIGGIADNRGTDNTTVAPAVPAKPKP